MNPTIIASIIAAASTVLTPLITFFVIRAYDNKSLSIISKDRKKTLIGMWSGLAVQDMDTRGEIEYPLTVKISASSKIVEAKTRIMYHDDIHNPVVEFIVKGGFSYERFLKLDYYSENRGAVHFGSMVLELSADAKELNGKFVGYGLRSQYIVTGKIQLRKVFQ